MRAVPVLALAAAAALAACASDDTPEDLGLQEYLQYAQSYAEGGHYEQALSQFRRALRNDPTNRKALLGEANCLSQIGLRETPEAGAAILEASEKAEALDPAAYGEGAWKVHLVQGMVGARLADLWERKADLARKGVETGEAGAAGRLREAEAEAAAQDRRSREAFRAVLAQEEQPLAKNNLTALFFLASRSALRSRDSQGYDEALGYFRRYTAEVEKSRNLWEEMKKREPKLADVYDAKLRNALREEIELRDLMADIHFKRRDHEASIGELNRVLALDPYRAEAFYNRGRNQEELGRYGAAADDYNRFLRITELPKGSAQVIEAAERMNRCEGRVREKMAQ